MTETKKLTQKDFDKGILNLEPGVYEIDETIKLGSGFTVRGTITKCDDKK